MRYFFFVFSRWVLTFFCKFFVEIAEITHWQWTIPVLDFFIKKRGVMLGKEAVYCMKRTQQWQDKAKKVVIAHHQFEKYLQGGKK